MDKKKPKNKEFMKWIRGESCHTRDNIVSTDWPEKLEKIPMFVPSYAKSRPEMTYIMSMEYGRIWHKEKEEWFSRIYKDNSKESQDMRMRRKKLRMEFLEAKRQAEIKIKERKAERKLKAEAEALEKAKKTKAKLEKSTVKKKDKKQQQKPQPKQQQQQQPKQQKQEQPPQQQQQKPPQEQETETDKKDICPEGWKQVELTLQCDCAANKEKDEQGKKTDKVEQVKKTEKEQKKIEVPCTPECIQDEIAEAVQKALVDEQAECRKQE